MDGVVDDESKIIIDVLICGSNEMSTETETGNSWENYFRGRQIGKFYGDSNSLVYTMKAHPTVQFRYIVQQSVGKMTGLNELNMDGDFTWAAQEQGRTDAQNALNGSSQANVALYAQEWIKDEEGLVQLYGEFGNYINERAAEDQMNAMLLN